MFDYRTDLAFERLEIKNKEKSIIDGILQYEDKISKGIKVTNTKIINEKGSKLIDKPMGNYTTITFESLNSISKNKIEKITKVFERELKKYVGSYKNILIIGLGNKNLTADLLGPVVTDNLKVTRNILPDSEIKISAIAPGVLGTTGIESFEIISGILSKIYIDEIIVIDSLITNNASRILKSIQITDTGIIPGAGVNNKRKEISRKTTGKRVVAIGVPTVVDTSTIVYDTIDILSNRIKEFKFFKDIGYNDKFELIKFALGKSDGNMIVMPKETDNLIDTIKNIISNGINNALK